MPTKTIAIDIDDVLADHASAFAEYTNKKFGLNIKPNDYQEEFGNVWKTDLEETVKRTSDYLDSDHVASCEAIKGAGQVLKELKNKFKLIAITSRRNSISQITKDWLNKYYPDIFDDVVFAGFYDIISTDSLKKTKGELAKNIGADYFIDDQIKHVFSAADLGMTAILFGDYNWNKAEQLPEKVIRLKNWNEVLKYFESK